MSLANVLLIVALLAANGFFVAAEFALIAARRTQLDLLASGGSRAARTVLRAMDDVPLMVAGAQLGITIASLVLGSIGEPAVAHALEPVFHDLHVSENLIHPIAFAIALSLIVTGHILFGEMVPKNIALAGPDRSALFLVPPLFLFSKALRPLLFAIKSLADLCLKAIRVPHTSEERTVYTAAELPALITESRQHHLLDQEEHDLMIATLSLHARPVSEVMVPLNKLVTLPEQTTARDLARQAGIHGHSRFPVLSETGELKGYLHILDALRGQPDDLLPVRTLPRLPATKTLSEVLASLRARRVQFAALTGADGSVVGVATLDDVLAALMTGPAARRPKVSLVRKGRKARRAARD